MIKALAVTDRAGNALGTQDLTSQFTLVESRTGGIGGDGNWNDGTDWSTGVPPGPNDRVFIDVEGAYNVTLTGSRTVRQVIVGGASGSQTLWVLGSTAGSHTTITAAQGFTNAGTLRLESINASRTSSLTVSPGALTKTGTITVGVGTGGAHVSRAGQQWHCQCWFVAHAWPLRSQPRELGRVYHKVAECRSHPHL